MNKKGKHQAPKRKISKSKSPDCVYKRNRIKSNLIFSVIITFVLASFYLSTLAVLENSHLQQAFLENEIQRLETENERIKLEIGYVDVLDRVEQRATEELGMVMPGPLENVPINMSEGLLVVDSVSVFPEVSENEATLTDNNVFASAQQSISGILSRWTF